MHAGERKSYVEGDMQAGKCEGREGAHLRHNHFLGTIDDEIATLVELALTILGRVFLHDLRPRQMTEPRLEHDRKVPNER
jgi:hypothetical protein